MSTPVLPLENRRETTTEGGKRNKMNKKRKRKMRDERGYPITSSKKDSIIDYSVLNDETIPPSLHGFAPRNFMPREWWSKTKASAIAKHQGRCHCCGRAESKWTSITRKSPRLECHERYNMDHINKIMEYVETVALCSDCHACIHIGRASIVLSKHDFKRLKVRKRRLGSISHKLRDHEWGWQLSVYGLIMAVGFESLEEYRKKYP